jgi:phage terminase large subunit-like protein
MRLLAQRSLVPDLPLYPDEVKKALDIFTLLRLPDVTGQPRLGDVCGDWMLDIVSALFGSFDRANNKRHVQEFFLLVPKKNSKSTSAAAIMLTAVLMNRRPEAEFIFVAPTIEIAGISFRQARGMIRAEPKLLEVFQIRDNFRTIVHRVTQASLKILAMDADIITGTKATGILIDETHVFSTKPHANDLFLEMRGAQAARPDGFMLQISTQSKAPPAGVFKSELQRARDVRDGKLELPRKLLPVLYELPPRLADQWEDETYWPLVNPNLGRSVDIDFLRSSLIDSRRKGPGELALFASQHMNLEIGLALRSDRWAGSEFWDKQTDAELTLERVLERSDAIVVGVDGGGLDDLFAICTLGRCRETKDWLSWSHAWCHESVLQRRQTIAATLQDFAKAGELTIVSDELEDISAIVEIVADIKRRGILTAVAVDPAGIGSLIDSLAAVQVTIEGKQVIGAPQGYQMMNAIKSAERKLANGTLWHSKSDLMRWAVSNVKIEPTATAIRATKQNAGDAKIDPVMALFDAVTVMQSSPAQAPTYHLSFL